MLLDIPTPNALRAVPPPLYSQGRLSARFRNVNVLLFIITLCAVAAVMVSTFEVVVRDISARYAESYALSSADALGAHISGEISLMSKAAHSADVVSWLADESDGDKKALAFEEISGIVGELYSFNMYISVGGSLNEYRLVSGENANGIQPFTVLDETKPVDAWYFNCAASEQSYTLSVDIDHVMQRKRVWLDYKVTEDGGEVLGVLSTGLEFSHIVGELLSHNTDVRGLIIDENGVIHMDSSLKDDRDFMYSDFDNTIDMEFSDPSVLSAIKTCMDSIKGYAAEKGGQPLSIDFNSGVYRHLTVASIPFTNWSVVVLSGDTSMFDISLFIPVAAAILFLLIAFALAINAANYRLIFKPLGKLDHSLTLLSGNSGEGIYGIDRDDELGHLSQTIQDLFDKANIDALTGIYNRRFMEANLDQVIGFLSRSDGLLSVLMLDIDFFKRYNDTYGHDQGDNCLRAVAQSLADGIKRVGDFIARYGGEEFIAIMPNTDEAGARLIAEKFLDNVRALNILHEHNDAAPYVTVSIGVTTGKVEYGQSWENYVKRADQALYESKQSGRNRYTFRSFPESDSPPV